jgi:hypothetical protein
MANRLTVESFPGLFTRAQKVLKLEINGSAQAVVRRGFFRRPDD